MRVASPLGEYPFEFRRLERRGRELVVVGSLAGFESSVVLGPEDALAIARRAALPLAAAGFGYLVVLAVRRRVESSGADNDRHRSPFGRQGK